MIERHFWVYDEVQDELVGAMWLWRRSPGGGAWPFAGDGPWHLMQRSLADGDYDARGGDLTSSETPLPLTPLSCSEVERRDMVSEWLAAVPVDDRAIVVAAVTALAFGHGRVPWRRIKHRLGIRFGEDGLRRRFERSICLLCRMINRGEVESPAFPLTFSALKAAE